MGARNEKIVRVLRRTGFTLVELVMTMMIVGIMAIAVLPRFTSVNDFEAVGYADQLEALFRFAQKSAVAERRLVYLDFGVSPPSMSLASSASNCAAGAAMVLPGGAPAVPKSTVTVASSGATKICFNGLGKPYAPTFTALSSALTVTVKYQDGSTAKIFYVEPETGYVHE